MKKLHWTIAAVAFVIVVYSVGTHLTWKSSPSEKIEKLSSMTDVAPFAVDPFWANSDLDVVKLRDVEGVFKTEFLASMEESPVYEIPADMTIDWDSPANRNDFRVFPSGEWKTFIGFGNKADFSSGMFQVRPVGASGRISIILKKKGGR